MIIIFTNILTAFFIVIISLLLIIYFVKFFNRIINYYPQEIINVNISKKKRMDDNDALDFYIINYGKQKILEHIAKIENWKEKKLKKVNINSKKYKRIIKRWVKNSYKAFKFEFYREKTRYKQENYIKYPYIIKETCNSFNISEQKILERIDFLESNGCYITYNQYNRVDQRKLLTQELREIIKKRDNFTCQECGKQMFDEVGLQIDHIIPIAKGGKTVPKNLRVLCSKCNGKKGSKITEI